MIKIWGRDTSINVQSVMWCCAELGLDVERVDMGGAFGGLDTPDYGEMNPHRMIPVLRDGNTTLWEAGAILRYLANKYGDSTFWPEDPGQRAQIDMWAEWGKVELLPVLIKTIFWQLIRTPKAERDEAALAAAFIRYNEMLKPVEARLALGPYVMGENFTLADIAIGQLFYRADVLNALDKQALPNCAAYFETLAARPAYARHVMIDMMSTKVPGA